MESDRWKQVDSLLLSVLEMDPGERSDFLRKACSGDASLEREVRSLLDAQVRAGSFLERPAIEVASDTLSIDQSGVRLSGPSLAGQTISHYEIIEKLGVGGMGIVWKARDTRLGRFVALKFLPAAMMSDIERKRRFVQEAKTASALNHPNIVTIYEIDRTGDADFIAMEYVAGKTLDQLIARKGFRRNDVIHCAVQVADALAAAHDAGIVHRDLKPGNIMVTSNGTVKVLDFGLAKLAEKGGAAAALSVAGSLNTAEGMIVGTVSFMSPEQAEGKKVDSRSDIFSFGSVLYEMITGKRAFRGDSMVSILSSILRDEPKPATEIVKDLPRDLDRVIRRCLQKDPCARYQHAGDLKIDLLQANDVSREEPPPRRSNAQWWWLAATLVCTAVAFGVGMRLRTPSTSSPQWNLSRLTSDAGLSSSPALSPDGKLVAYSSDRAGDGQWDLYIKQVAGGQPIRLTTDGHNNISPDFSPDGSKIIFRSNRDGGGIFEIPAFGGEVRLLVREGRDPKYSPDGSQLAYWIGGAGVAAAVPGSGSVWVVPVIGGPPRQVGAQFTAARYPIWSRDGKHLLVVGYTSTRAYDASGIDWWMLDPDGPHAVRTGAYEALARAGLRPADFKSVSAITPTLPVPGCWQSRDNQVAFATVTGDAVNLWQIGVSPNTGKVDGVPRRLTVAPGDEKQLSCGGSGAIVFTNGQTNADIWSLPIDLNGGKPRGPLERIIQGPANRHHVSLSSDGRSAAFGSDQTGRSNIWIHDFSTGKETVVANSMWYQRFPVIDSSGLRVAFSVYEENYKRVVYIAGAGGTPEKMCEGCLRATDWSRDDKTLLTFGGDPYEIDLLDVASHRQTALLKDPAHQLLYAHFAPDNRWVSFTIRMQSNRARIAIAPIDGPKPIPENSWITVAEGSPEDWAYWSPNGQMLYFTSNRDGHFCVWAQRIDPMSHKPAGEPFAALHLHGRVAYRQGGWSAAGGRIAIVLAEDIGNIWMMSPTGGR